MSGTIIAANMSADAAKSDAGVHRIDGIMQTAASCGCMTKRIQAAALTASSGTRTRIRARAAAVTSSAPLPRDAQPSDRHVRLFRHVPRRHDPHVELISIERVLEMQIVDD